MARRKAGFLLLEKQWCLCHPMLQVGSFAVDVRDLHRLKAGRAPGGRHSEGAALNKGRAARLGLLAQVEPDLIRQIFGNK